MSLCYNSHIGRSVFSTKDGTIVLCPPTIYAEKHCFSIHCKNKITNLMVVSTVARI